MKMSKYKATYLNADDIDKPTLVTVREVVEEKVGNGEKAVIYFDELDQGMALSKTAIIQLEDIFGSDESDDWTGEIVVLFNDKSVQFQGKKVGGLRFRKPKNGTAKPVKTAPVEAPPEGDDIPF